ncbi:hypothetical protein GOV04_00910 [Candidatus Woesearchaeota archaeon]|nr:hypothetical protein [Candidatus Woesearchaeota archaeon]
MTVIVGVETNTEPRAVVIGTDRLQIQGYSSIAGILQYLVYDDADFGIDDILWFAKKHGFDKAKTSLGRKLQISHGLPAILAQTGTDNESHKKISQLLLCPKDFLADDEYLKKLFFPVETPDEETMKRLINDYRSSFDLPQRLSDQLVPELKRMVDLQVVQKKDFSVGQNSYTLWDRNFNTELCEYLYGLVMRPGGIAQPQLGEVSVTGTIHRAEYSANGAGKNFALEHLREKFGTQSPIDDIESFVNRPITLDEAVEAVRGAILHANEKSIFCEGLDFAILTVDGVRTYFDDVQKDGAIDLAQLLEQKISRLKNHTKRLEKAKEEYLK